MLTLRYATVRASGLARRKPQREVDRPLFTVGHPPRFTDNFGETKLSVMPEFYTTEETARLIGVGQRRVQQMIDNGDLARVTRGLISATSVDRYLAAHPSSRTRAWAEHTAWAAIALLSGTHVDWLGPTQTSRLRAALRQITEPADLVTRTRDRAAVHTYVGHPSAIRRLTHDLVTTNQTALGLTPSPPDRVDGYIAATTLDSTASFLGLREDPKGSITVRATNFNFDIVVELAGWTVLAALDAATSLDPRERGLGERALATALESYPR